MCFSEKANSKSGLNIAINTWFELNDKMTLTEKDVLENRRELNNTIESYHEFTLQNLNQHSKDNLPFISDHSIHQDMFKDISMIKQVTIDQSKGNKSKKAYVWSSTSNCFDSTYLTCPQTEMKQLSIEYFLTKARQLQNEGKEYFYISSLVPTNESFAKLTPKVILDNAYSNPIDTYTWINFGNVQTLGHYDGRDNLLCQVHGSKRIILIPPFEIEKIYPCNPYPLRFLETLTDNTNQSISLFPIKSLECFNLLLFITKESAIFEHFEASYVKYEGLYSFIFQCVSSIVEKIPEVTITPLSPFQYVTQSDLLQQVFHTSSCMRIHRNEQNDLSCKSTFICLINTDTNLPLQFVYGTSNVTIEPYTLCIVQKNFLNEFKIEELMNLSIVVFDIGLKMMVVSC
jgi:hypothetical protein